MYRIMNSIILLGLLVGPALTAQAATRHFPLEIFDVLDDHRLVVFLRDNDIAASPQWRPGEGAPQLTIAEAIEQIRQHINEHDLRLQDAHLHEIELKPIHGHEQEHRWYYLLQMRVPGKHKAYYFAVLFSGKVVPAIEEPMSIK